MIAAGRPVPRQRTLGAWATAMQQQSRVWLPLELPGQNLAWTVLAASAPVGAVLWFLMTSSLEMRGVERAVPALVIGCLVAGAFFAARRTQRRNERCGWEVDFQQCTLTPVGLPEFSAIEVGPDYSLGCYPGGGGQDQGVSFQLELRHARKGPVAALTLIHMGRCGPADLRVLDQCVGHLSHRLGIRRSGAPVPTHFGLAPSGHTDR